MFTLAEAYRSIGGRDEAGMWDGKVFCAKIDAASAMLPNKLNETVGCYSFTIVLKGSTRLRCNGNEVTLNISDLHTYLPGLSFEILDVSKDYQGISLIVDENTAHNTLAFHHLIQTSYFPLAHFGRPVLALSPADTARLVNIMSMIHDYILHPSAYRYQILHMLMSVFIFDLQDIQRHIPSGRSISQRQEEIFISFYSLLRRHFMEHHDIGFYASQLNISTTHLSRIVKQISGHTVISFIDQMLAIEATWLLSATRLTIAQIADRLHFATTASFDKFFARMKGSSPKQFRQESKEHLI